MYVKSNTVLQMQTKKKQKIGEIINFRDPN